MFRLKLGLILLLHRCLVLCQTLLKLHRGLECRRQLPAYYLLLHLRQPLLLGPNIPFRLIDLCFLLLDLCLLLLDLCLLLLDILFLLLDLRFLLLAYDPSASYLAATRNGALTVQADFSEDILLAELVLVVEIARFEDNDNERPDLLLGHCERVV